MSKILILYYSRKGQNYVNGRILDLEKGNTEICAEYIKEAVGGTLFKIDTVKTYSLGYHECTEEALKELKEKARPSLKEYLNDLDDYEHIFVCGPCWWGTYPMAVFSLLEKLNFAGKKVTGLMTHEGSGLGQSQRDLKQICKGAIYSSGIAIHGADSIHAKDIIADWAKAFVNNN